MKKLKLITLLVATTSVFAHTHTHSEDTILEMILHPFTGVDHILGLVALGAISFYVVKKIKASGQKK